MGVRDGQEEEVNTEEKGQEEQEGSEEGSECDVEGEEEDAMGEYEKARAEQIKANRRVLERFGIPSRPTDTHTHTPSQMDRCARNPQKEGR